MNGIRNLMNQIFANAPGRVCFDVVSKNRIFMGVQVPQNLTFSGEIAWLFNANQTPPFGATRCVQQRLEFYDHGNENLGFFSVANAPIIPPPILPPPIVLINGVARVSPYPNFNRFQEA